MNAFATTVAREPFRFGNDAVGTLNSLPSSHLARAAIVCDDSELSSVRGSVNTRHVDEFLEWVFDHPVAESDGQEWYWGEDEELLWTGPLEELQALVVAFFENSARAFGRFSRAQLAQGLWFLMGFHSEAPLRVLLDDARPPSSRVALIESMLPFFVNGFARSCTEGLAPDSQGDEFDEGAFMWWDLVCDICDDAGEEPAVDRAALAVLETLVARPEARVQRSALHGLNHWARRRPNEVAAIIDGALASGHIDARLLSYAMKARTGLNE